MDGWTIGADVAAMITSLSVLTATITWVSGRWRAWRAERAQTSLRNWHGYIMLEAVDTWYLRLADDPAAPTGRVVLEVLSSKDGTPDAGLAYSMRVNIERDGMLSRAPTPEEFSFLTASERARLRQGLPGEVNEGRGRGKSSSRAPFGPLPRIMIRGPPGVRNALRWPRGGGA